MSALEYQAYEYTLITNDINVGLIVLNFVLDFNEKELKL